MKLARLLGITMLLLGRRRVGAQELSERFEVSVRTIYRDLEALNAAGVPVVSYPGLDGGYEILKTFQIDRQYLSMDELRSMLIALKGVQAAWSEQQLGRLLDKVSALLNRSETGVERESGAGQVVLELNPWRCGEREKRMLGQLEQALEHCRSIRMAYTDWEGKESEREIEPIGLVLRDMVWYLYGFCRLRQDYRTFRLNRIQRLEPLEERFERHSMTIQELDRRWEADGEPQIELRLLFHPSVRTRVRDDYPAQAIRQREDGWLEVDCAPYGGYWMYSRLLSYGPCVKIVWPPEAALELRRMAQGIVELYAD
ncbi:YafY family transcriptional regulator [Paenibacillus albicereus]|uniref:YafY family transcriptional regulator n=1 Tax=Paenibacillus albicereus TaxID=2726185 RepID=A0A6H2H1C8_9BACL|nr:YafY family protein [Paenibacillus albicereus]QJC53457.1 YafY family transcriptional regulator [Paenibacillus albicereus]